jgi:hypothetical protein
MSFPFGFTRRLGFQFPFGKHHKRVSQAGVRKGAFALRLEVLEDRCVPTLALDPYMTPLDPGGMTVYSSDTQTHWLRNANLATTKDSKGNYEYHFGIDINDDGSMTFSQAQKWVYKLNNVDNGPGQPKGYLGHSNWILPGQFVGAGFNQASSDLEKLFYNEFGCYPGESITQITLPFFYNFQPYLYWDGDEVAPGAGEFSFGNGFQGTTIKGDDMYVIPEYSDDTQAAPAPNSVNGIKPPTGGDYPPVYNSLVPSSDGIVYDKALDIYWLADANLAATNTFGISQGINTNPKDPNYLPININPDGSMSYATAVAWIDAMNNYDNGNGYLGHNNWRLPMAQDTDAAFYISGSGIGDEFQGSELGELYYTELGATAGSTILLSPTATAGTSTVGPFINFQPYLYWAGTQTAGAHANGNGHSTFSFGNGFQGANINTNEMYVIPVFDGPRTVTNTSDDGIGTLRSVIRTAHENDLIDLSGLKGQIDLQSPININSDNVGQYEALDIEGPGAAKLAINGSNANGIFDFGPAPTGAPMTTIAGLTLENAKANEGGAIFDDGASLTLRSDIFKHDQAEFTLLTQISALGGALTVFAGETVGMNVNITNCQFNNDSAIATHTVTSAGLAEGGAIDVDAGASTYFTLSVTGTTFSNDFARSSGGLNGDTTFPATDGGPGDGGAVYLSAEHSFLASFLFSDDNFSDCSALGGDGGNGAAGADGQDGGNGGQGRGGAIFYSNDRAIVPYLSIASSTFTSNFAAGGSGGDGGNARKRAGNGGAGGSGGDGFGGAFFANFASSNFGTVAIQGDTFSLNSIQGGTGGNGGSGGSAATGGAGGAGGLAGGGGIAVTIGGPAVGALFNILQSAVNANTALGGNGGAGGIGKDGGRGGNGAGIRGAGIYLNSAGKDNNSTWTLDAVTVESNNGYSGNGGQGGSGTSAGGDGGNSKNSLGGGIYDAFAGTLNLYQCLLESNDLFDGAGGSGGDGATIGLGGRDSVSRGGGLYIHSKSKAQATADTVISGNDADRRPDVFGALGTN